MNDRMFREMVCSVPGEIANGHFPCSSWKHFRLSQPARHQYPLRLILMLPYHLCLISQLA